MAGRVFVNGCNAVVKDKGLIWRERQIWPAIGHRSHISSYRTFPSIGFSRAMGAEKQSISVSFIDNSTTAFSLPSFVRPSVDERPFRSHFSEQPSGRAKVK